MQHMKKNLREKNLQMKVLAFLKVLTLTERNKNNNLSPIKEKSAGYCNFVLTASGKQMSNSFAPCFSSNYFVLIPSYMELPCLKKTCFFKNKTA